MFGLTFGKLLVLAAVVALVWYGWRRLHALARTPARRRDRPDGAQPSDDAIDLVRDPKTGSYGPRGDSERRD